MKSVSPYSNEYLNEHLYKATQSPLPFYLLDWLENIAAKKDKSILNFSEQYFLKKAMRETGLSDWGPETFKPALRKMLSSCHEDARLTLFGKFCFRNKIINLLKNRLNIQDELKKYPEILHERIHKPLFIVSLPRTGTTLLHNLLSLDPCFRYVRGWEAMRPSLNPKFTSRGKDPRIKWREKELRDIKRYFPELLKIHPLAIEGPEECHYLLANSLSWDITFDVLFNLPQYTNWLKSQDKVPVYQYYLKILKLLQWHRPGRHWVLKSPDHLNHMDELLKVFPDACIVFIHRDPQKAVPSFCNLTAFGRLINSKKINFYDIGKKQTHKLSSWISHAQNVRNKADASRFFDISYKTFINDPKDTVKSIYRYFGYNYNDPMEKQIDIFLKRNKRKKKKGANLYRMEQFGLTASQINSTFEWYINHYNISTNG